MPPHAVLASLLAFLAIVFVPASSAANRNAPRASQSSVGGPAPELDVAEWYLSRPLSLAELRGRTVLLVSLRTWSEPCKGVAQELASRAESEAAKGLVVIGLFADEEPENVERWITEQRARFPIALLATREFERAAALDGFPHAAIVDSIGTLVYGDDYGRVGPPLGDTLAKAPKPPKASAKLERVRAAALEGAYDKAWSALAKLGEAGKLGSDADEAARWRAWLEARATKRLERAKALVEFGAWKAAVDSVAGLANVQPAYPVAADVRTFLTELAARPTYKAELAAAPAYEAARAKELAGSYLAAVELYEAARKKHAKLALANAAKKRIDELVARGVIGTDWSCDECKRAYKACPKHLVKWESK
ncbi:MAG: TlpA family protein disulfide reductase [Planctomycetes bacterium]|nr:TlpA family protein disulfide reductase [Planctomycetota bacterium]